MTKMDLIPTPRELTGFIVGAIITIVFTVIGLGLAWTSLMDEFEKICPIQRTTKLKTYSTLGRITTYECTGDNPKEWACLEIPRGVKK